jgi:hypothetical protein
LILEDSQSLETFQDLYLRNTITKNVAIITQCQNPKTIPIHNTISWWIPAHYFPTMLLPPNNMYIIFIVKRWIISSQSYRKKDPTNSQGQPFFGCGGTSGIEGRSGSSCVSDDLILYNQLTQCYQEKDPQEKEKEEILT